jgi:hypothetical protein
MTGKVQSGAAGTSRRMFPNTPCIEEKVDKKQ